LCDAVKITIGPRGRNAVISQNSVVTNDGVTVAHAFKCKDQNQNLGAEILRQASQKTNKQVGDGTTSVIVLGCKVLNLAAKKNNPVVVKEQLLSCAKSAADYIDTIAKKCNTYESLLSVTTNSCANKGDGKIVADAITAVGRDGVVIIEESETCGITMTLNDGLQCPLVLASPYFVTKPDTLESSTQDARLAVFESPCLSIKPLVSILEIAREKALKICIVAPDFSPEVLAALVLNKVRGGIDVTALKVDSQSAEAVLGDVAAVTGAKIFDGTEEIKFESFGHAKKIIAGMNDTKIIAQKNAEKIKARADQIRGQIHTSRDEYMTQKLRERLAKLTSGIAKISVGCPTTVETQERKLRIDDALAAGLAATRDGVVSGGGLAYLAAAKYLKTKKTNQNIIGGKILARALCEITKQICKNAGMTKKRFLKSLNDEIIDPAAVIKSVIINAVSVAATLITTEVIV
jgi:chaperonin GroEL